MPQNINNFYHIKQTALINKYLCQLSSALIFVIQNSTQMLTSINNVLPRIHNILAHY